MIPDVSISPLSSYHWQSPFEFPRPDRWQQSDKWVALVAGLLTQHFHNTKADDSHAALRLYGSRRHILISENFRGCQDRISPSRCIELNHMPTACAGPSSIHLSFNLAAVPRAAQYLTR